MLPEQFLERMKLLLGAEYEAFLRGFEQDKYQALRLNALKIHMEGKSAADLPGGSGALAGAGQGEPVSTCFGSLVPVPWAENGYYYGSEDHPGKHPYHEAGVYYIQEPSAMAPVTLLEVQPGERVLDLCAAPGGKTTQIAAALQGRGLLVCNEIHPARAKILSENVERMGIRNACVLNETPLHLSEVFEEYFDKILVDAPCSGEGMFRKSEIACEEWSPENVEGCAQRQEEILDCAARMLRPGGRLVYSTCTFAPLENEGSVSRFVERHPEFRILPVEGDGEAKPPAFCKKEIFGSMSDGRADWVEKPAPGIEKTLRLWPHCIKGEGHYAAVLQKAGEILEAYVPLTPGGLEKGLSIGELGDFAAFAGMNLKINSECLNNSKYLKFGDNIYQIPQEMPALKGLKVLRPGLHVGTLKKNRFEPSHALALAISSGEAAHVWNLSSKEPTISAYLNGQTFFAEGEKGWYLICVDGFSIGWGKLAGGIMKNHYPKGLRQKW